MFQDETRRAVRKALDLGKVLFSLGSERFERLVVATQQIKSPSKEEINKLIQSGMSLEEAISSWFFEVYANVATAEGFTREQGKAMLSYAALLKDLDGLQ